MTGIEIEDTLQSSRLSFLKLDKKVPLESWLICPSCGTGLKTICHLVGGDDHRIRFGLCENCGYMGYMDRPSSGWMNNFYSREWDKSFPRSAVEIKKGILFSKVGKKASRYLAASLIEKIKPDKEKPVCEIGSGYGEVLRYFQNSGFKKIIGVENSKRRAEMVKEALGFDILHGSFEEDRIQNQLSKQKPFGLIFSHHVLEHTYDPGEVIKKISSLQDQGGYLILALPNAEGEHINYALFYLVHLHSFTKESLELLLNKNSYEIIADSSPDDSNTIIAARKTKDPRLIFKLRQDYFDSVSRRVTKGLALEKMVKQSKYVLYWEQGPERDWAEIKERGSGFWSKIAWFFKNKIVFVRSRFFKRFTPGYTMLVSPIESYGQSFEIRFRGKITFLVK